MILFNCTKSLARRLLQLSRGGGATPVSGENVVEQYVGRLNWDYDGNENVIAYDYVDRHIPKFDKMYAARLKAYKKKCRNLLEGS